MAGGCSQLTVFPEVPGKRVHRKDSGRARRLSTKENKLGPVSSLADGIYIVTVSENTPAQLFEAAHLLNAASADDRQTGCTHGPGFVPIDAYDSAVAVVGEHIVGGATARRSYPSHLRMRLADTSKTDGDFKCRPTLWYLWVHPAHRRKGLGRQLLEAIAKHFERDVAQMGVWLPITEPATALLRSMGIEEILACEGTDKFG